MAVSRYDTPAQAEFINTYVPIPFEQLYTLGKDAKADVDKALAEQSSALAKWSEFKSPSAVDTQTWYNSTVGAAKPIIDELASNPDMIKTAEGRAKLRSVINNVDTAKLSQLQQSRDALLQRQKVDQELMIQGKYNPEWHGIDYNNYNTLNNGIFSDISPLAYKSVQDLTEEYYKGIQDSYIGTKGGYDYTGVTKSRIEEIADKNLSGIMITPEAQKHMDIYKKQTGASDDQAKTWLRERVIQDNLKYVRENREANKFDLLQKQLDARKPKGGEEATTAERTLVKNAVESFMDKGPSMIGTNAAGKTMAYNPQSKLDRIAKTFDLTNPDNVYRKNYVEKTPTSKLSVNDLRMKSANKIITSLAMPFGESAKFINDAELGDRPKVVNANGRYIYDARDITGIMPEDFYVNERMGVSRENYNWSPEKNKLAQDLLNGSIPGVAIAPSDAFLPMNVSPSRESFSQRGEVYIPVSYLREVFPNKLPSDVTANYAEIWESDEFKAFAKEAGLSKVGETGSIIPRKPSRLDSEYKNTGYEYSDQPGMFNEDVVGVAQQFPGTYVKMSTIRPVLTNPLTRNRANQLEAIARKIGTKNTAAINNQSEFENFITE